MGLTMKLFVKNPWDQSIRVISSQHMQEESLKTS